MSTVSIDAPSARRRRYFVVPSAEKIYEELIFRNRNIPGGLHKDAGGAMVFETHDPDGVRILFRQTDACR